MVTLTDPNSRCAPGAASSEFEILSQWILEQSDGIWLDNPVQGGFASGARTLLACQAVEWLRGAAGSLSELPQILASGCKQHERGIIAGSIMYAGGYQLGIFPQYAVFNHQQGAWEHRPPSEWLMEASLFDGLIAKPVTSTFRVGDFSMPEREMFLRQVLSAKEYIKAGDIYQVNLSHRFEAAFEGKPQALFAQLRAISPAPYSSWLNLPDRLLISASPECFLKFEGADVITRPIKGTSARGTDKVSDASAARILQSSDKERAELLMITDLERNDLGQICEYGSVQVEEMFALETFAQVHHLVSTIRGRLRDGVDAVDALLACFPGGSITGAPKKRAMEIIQELESDPREDYTGAIGWLGMEGGGELAITIRTLCVQNGRIFFNTGAGIVADSEAGMEYEETLHKARGLLAACGKL